MNKAKAEYLKENWDGMDRAERAAAVQDLVDNHGWVRAQLASHLGVHHSAVNRLYGLPNGIQELPTEEGARPTGTQEKRTEKGDSLTVETKSTRIKNVDDLIEQCEIDLDSWELIEGTVNKWEMGAAEKSHSIWLEGKKGNKYLGYVQGDTKIIVEPLFQVKARFKKRVSVINARLVLEEMKEEAKQESVIYAPVPYIHKIRPHLLEAALMDHHMGKLSWAPEAGQDYDLKTAEELGDETTSVLIERAKAYDLAQIVYVVGNDLLHFDNLENATTHGTIVTADTRFQKVYKNTRRMMIRNILRLRELAPVLVKIVPGNHDTVSSFTLGDCLEVKFENCPDVVVDNSPAVKKYMQWGKNMTMWAHGNRGKLEDYPLLMATEQPKMWGETVFREAHTGDKHQRKVIELHGVAVRILPTLCAPDDWHAEMCFTGNIRACDSFVYDEENGMIGTITHNLPAKFQIPKAA